MTKKNLKDQLLPRSIIPLLFQISIKQFINTFRWLHAYFLTGRPFDSLLRRKEAGYDRGNIGRDAIRDSNGHETTQENVR